MSQFSIQFIRVFLSLCICVTTIHAGKESCNCRCTLPPYDENENVCEWLRRNSPKVHSNEKQIEHLTRENWGMYNFKRDMETEMYGKVLPFIERVTQQLNALNPAENLNSNTDEPEINVAAEIEKLKVERDAMQAKLEQIEKNYLRITDNLGSSVNAIETQAVQMENIILQRINMTEKQVLEMTDGMFVQITKTEDQNLKMKREILGKFNETEIQISNLSDDVYLKFNDLESKTFTMRDEFLNQVKLQINQTAIAKNELLVKVKDVEEESSKVKDEFLQKANDLKKQISNARDELFLKMNETVSSVDREMKGEFITKIIELEENSVKQRRELKIELEQMQNSLRHEMSTQESSWTHLKAKLDQIEEVLEELHPKEISSTLSSIWYNVSQIHIDSTVMWDNFTEMNNGAAEILKNISAIWSRLQPIKILKTFQSQNNCTNILPPSNTIPAEGEGLYYYRNRSIQDPLLTLLWIVSSEQATYWDFNVCISIAISNHWSVISSSCLQVLDPRHKVHMNRYHTIGLWLRVKPFLFSENQLCSTCHSPTSDIALLKIDDNKSLPYTTFACLPTNEMKDEVSGSAFFLTYHLSDELHLIKVTIISDDECRKFYSSFDSSMVCTQYNEHALKSCKSIYDGVLLKNIENRTVLVGVVQDCGSPEKPALYVEVAYFSNWIYSFTNRLEKEE